MSRRLGAVLAALLLAFAAVALRLWVMERTFPVRPLGDEMYYVVVAANLADGYGHVYGGDARALRPPAHSWLLSRFADAGALMARPQDSPSRRLGVRLRMFRLMKKNARCLKRGIGRHPAVGFLPSVIGANHFKSLVIGVQGARIVFQESPICIGEAMPEISVLR